MTWEHVDGIHIDTLGREARSAWPIVAAVLPAETYLAGGTALALRLGHRRSFDLDLFSPRPFDVRELAAAVGGRAERCTTTFGVEAFSEYKLACRVGGAKVEFTHESARLLHPATPVNGLPVAAVEDIAAMKIAAITDRGALRDWYDLMVIQQCTGWTHDDCYSMYRARYIEYLGQHQAALVADTLCQWYPGMAGLTPDPNLRDLHGHPVEEQTRSYWRKQAGALHQQLAQYKRRSARAEPPTIRQRTLGVPQQLDPTADPSADLDVL